MKHHAKGRPIGKCKGCRLNLRTTCAAGVEPLLAWSRGTCRHWNDLTALERYQSPQLLTGARKAKLIRRVKAEQNRTVPHFNGQIALPVR